MTPPETAYFEALQVVADEPVRARRPLVWALWATAIALVAAHPIWVSRGMPVHPFLTPILEILHV